MTTTCNDVRLTRTGRIGHIELDRPRAINALTHDMSIVDSHVPNSGAGRRPSTCRA